MTRREWNPNFPKVVAGLNLDAPALIEASAGTGKTYAIEHLVLRMVAEKPEWKFESLLLLSFTEKTAGDLRKRIRERLKTESRNLFWTAAERTRFFEAHLRCDEASIHTLHGFCHFVLRAHALENGTLFDSEVTDDRTLLENSLDALLRGPWAHQEARLRDLLNGLEANAPADWRGYLISVALAYQPGRGDTLHPAASAKNMESLASGLNESAIDVIRSFRNFNEEFPKGMAIFLRIRDTVDSLRSHDPEAQTRSLNTFFLAIRANNKAVKDGFLACLSKTALKNPQWIRLAEMCQLFYDTAKRLQEAKRQYSLGLLAQAARELRERLALDKKRGGLLSYDDMVLKLVEAMRVRPALLQQLREKYHACVVDEFQDTDPLQWELLYRFCLEGENSPPLFLVGDPKQAIYGFRGGDLQTYLGARNRLHEMALRNAAQGDSLQENFRSQPNLTDALNSIFSQPGWFGLSEISSGSKAWKLPDSSDRIPFTHALVPENLRAKNSTSETAAVILRDFSEFTSKSEAQRSVFQWIASEIVDSVGAHRDASPPNSFNDFAVLTRTNTEALAAEKYLRRLGIPCRVRRRGGIFQGREADQIRLLLSLLETAGDPKTQAQILLLPFLRGFEDCWPRGLPESCPELIREWAALAGTGKWPEFFHSLLHETGFLYRLASETHGGSEVQTLQALARALTEEGLQKGLLLRGLLQRFDALRRGEGGERDGENPDDGADDRVTLMTLHMSKGLEFPVVFLASLSDSRKPQFYTLRGQNGFQHVLDKSDAAALHVYETQAQNEDRRLFYVGLTRAEKLLYVPLLPPKFSRTGSGPLGGFAAEALRAASGEHPGLFRLDAQPLDPVIPIRKDLKTGEATPDFPERDPWEEAGAFFHDRRRKLSSYSQLLKREAATVVEEDGRRVNREDAGAFIDETETVSNVETVTAADLPPGAHTGNALHELFETVDFATLSSFPTVDEWMNDFKIRQTAKHILQGFGLAEDYVPAALKVVWNTLHMPLTDPAGGPSFQLIAVADRKHEMEFLLPPPTPPLRGGSEEGQKIGGGYLWGFMDLIFRHQGRYYLLDWKSNLLDRYAPQDIEADIQKHRYDLQYQLYAVALDKWLETRLPDYHPEKHFGGIHYLYLRGASPKTFSGFAVRPGLKELREIYPARLRTVLGVKNETSTVP